jgi:hypothetical protein
LDTITRTILLVASCLGVVFLTKDKSFNYGVALLVLSVVIINTVAGNIIYWIASGLIEWLNSGEDDYERRYLQIKYKSFYYFYPILTSIIGITLGSIIIGIMVPLLNDESGRRLSSSVTNIE